MGARPLLVFRSLRVISSTSFESILLATNVDRSNNIIDQSVSLLSPTTSTRTRLYASSSTFDHNKTSTSSAATAALSFEVMDAKKKEEEEEPATKKAKVDDDDNKTDGGEAVEASGEPDKNNDKVIVEKKKALRKVVRARLKELDKETIQQQSKKVWERLFQLPQYKSAKSVGLFLSMPKGEIDTDHVLRDAIHQGKQIYVPEVGKNFELADMELVKVIVDSNNDNDKETEDDNKEEKGDDGGVLFHQKWPRNKWGIPEPPPTMPIITAKRGDIDVLVVPGLAFDRNGNRCGQGKGYYDRFIERMCTTTNNNTQEDKDRKQPRPPFLVAVGLQAQLVVDEDIPVAKYDRRMDMVLLPDEVIAVTK